MHITWNLKKYIIARKNHESFPPKFSDVFTGSLYNAYGDYNLDNKEIIAAPISPIVSNKKKNKV